LIDQDNRRVYDQYIDIAIKDISENDNLDINAIYDRISNTESLQQL